MSAFTRPTNFVREDRVRIKGVSRYMVTCRCTECGEEYSAPRASIVKRSTTLCASCVAKLVSTTDRNSKISKTLRDKFKANPELRVRASQLMKGRMAGPRHWNWKGGLDPVNQEQRNSEEYRVWRESVFARDEYACVLCNDRGCDLVAHHVLSWAEYPQHRFDVDNGITLCHCCHYSVHRYMEIYSEVRRSHQAPIM